MANQRCRKCHGFGHGAAECANERYISLEEIAIFEKEMEVPNERTWQDLLCKIESYHFYLKVNKDHRAYAIDYVYFHHLHNAPNASKEELFEVYIEGLDMYQEQKIRFPNFKYKPEVRVGSIEIKSVPKEEVHVVEEHVDDHSPFVVQEDVTHNSEFFYEGTPKFDEPIGNESYMVDQIESLEFSNAQTLILEFIPNKQQELEHSTSILANPIDGPFVQCDYIEHYKVEAFVEWPLLQRLYMPILVHQGSLYHVARNADFVHGVRLFCCSIRLIWEVAWSSKFEVKFF